MSAFRPTGRTVRVVKVFTSSGWKKRTTGTRDTTTAKKMQRMVAQCRDERAFDVLDAIGAGSLSVPAAWDLFKDGGGVEAIRARLSDVDLTTKRDGWLATVRLHVEEDTAQHYKHYLKELVKALSGGTTLPRTMLTVEALQSWLAAIPYQTGTKRKYYFGIKSFLDYCVSVGALAVNPLSEITAPPAGKKRDRHLTTKEAQALADAQPSPYRELSALLAGTGIEVSVALKLKVRDVDVAHREMRARGTKTHNRDRIARVADWAWPYVLRTLTDKLESARLFDTIKDRWEPQEPHADACTALEYEDYTMRDARHTWAVRMIRSGTPLEQVSKQLGHKDSTMVSQVYGVYQPTQREREHWEKIATAMDAAEAEAAEQAKKASDK